MRKSAILSTLFFIFLCLVSCSDADLNRGAEYWQANEVTYGIFCETVPIKLGWNVDSKMDIWSDNGGGMLVVEDASTAAEGMLSWKFTGTGSWAGTGIRVDPITAYRNMSFFNGGKIHFYFKGTKGFKVGLKSGANQESWIFPSKMTSYGLQTNGSWCEINIPISAFQYYNPNLDLSNMCQLFMWSVDSSYGYLAGDIYRLDGVYWSKSYLGPGVDTSMPTNFGLYSDSVENGVLWDNNCKLDIWSSSGAGMTLTNIQAGTGEGLNCWKLTGTGNWMGMGIRVNPETNYVNMSEYALGTLRLMIKGTNSVKIGIKSGSSTEFWLTPTQLSNFGYIPDGNWKTVVVPMTNFNTIDFTHISAYFMVACDIGLGYKNGIVFYLDNVYWSKRTN